VYLKATKVPRYLVKSDQLEGIIKMKIFYQFQPNEENRKELQILKGWK